MGAREIASHAARKSNLSGC